MGEVFASHLQPRRPAELELPLLFDRGRRGLPKLVASQAAAFDRLQGFSRGLLGKLADIEDAYLAGGAVVNSLCSEIWLGTDLDLFLVGGPPASNTQTLEKIYDAFRAHALGSGKFKTASATRTRASVTSPGSAGGDRRLQLV